jgi:quinol monooxygenase YgiN
MRKKPGNLGYIALERDNPVNHFAVVESWKDRSAYEAAQASEDRKTFLKALAPLLSAPVDERPHVPLSADQSRTQSAVAASGPAAVFVVTHVDVIPTKKDEGIAATKSLFAPSSAEKGNSAFDVLQQASRANHMTLFEIWKDRAALETHQSSDFVRAYRQALHPASGALYDQRTYRLLK